VRAALPSMRRLGWGPKGEANGACSSIVARPISVQLLDPQRLKQMGRQACTGLCENGPKCRGGAARRNSAHTHLGEQKFGRVLSQPVEIGQSGFAAEIEPEKMVDTLAGG
jgi:hypothetical protein